MAVTVCTGWSPAGFAIYGDRFLKSFDRHWPRDINLIAYVEEPIDLPRGEARSLWPTPIGLFLRTYEDDPVANGKIVTPRWRRGDHARGKSWRYDAITWCRQSMIPKLVAPELSDGDILIWLDADVVTFADIPVGFFENLQGDDPVVYLGRSNHSEIGFIGFRLPEARPVIDTFSNVFERGNFVALDEWHSAFVFDWARQKTGVLGRSLVPHDRRGHVWFDTPLGKYMDHTKGKRKIQGYSPESPIKWWQHR